MKWVIRFSCLLATAAVYTLLGYTGILVSLGGAGAALVTMALFYFGVFFLSKRLVRVWDARHPKQALPVSPEEVLPDVPAEVPEEALPVTEPKKVPRRRPVRRDVVGYQLAVCILVALLVVVGLKFGSVSGQVDDLQAQAEESYQEGFDEGERSGYSTGFDAGRQDAIEGLDLYSCFSSGFSSGSVTHGIVLPSAVEKAFQEWLASEGYPAE